MYCNNCGKEISNESHFCNYCGNPIVYKRPRLFKFSLSTKTKIVLFLYFLYFFISIVVFINNSSHTKYEQYAIRNGYPLNRTYEVFSWVDFWHQVLIFDVIFPMILFGEFYLLKRWRQKRKIRKEKFEYAKQ